MLPARRRRAVVRDGTCREEHPHGGGLGEHREQAADHHQDDLPGDHVEPPAAAGRIAVRVADTEADDELHGPRERRAEQAVPLEQLGATKPHSDGESCTRVMITASTLTKCQ